MCLNMCVHVHLTQMYKADAYVYIYRYIHIYLFIRVFFADVYVHLNIQGGD
jgi:hypothetical protein